MLSVNEMPEYRGDLLKHDVQFPSLDAEQTDRHKGFINDVVEYVVTEGEDVFEEDLTFLRSALVEDTRFWIWEFTDNGDEKHYATVSERPGKPISLGYDIADGLTPEQAILADYHDCY